MPFAIGVILALFIGISATLIGLDRDRAFYPVVMIVIASYYALFAVMGNAAGMPVLESIAVALFIVAAVAGFRYSLWLVVAALVLHGLFDLVHDRIILNRGVPSWWPPFCSAYDVVAGLYLAWLLKTGRRKSRGDDMLTSTGEQESNR